jgi:cytochrome c-type biogenesis protein CcmH
MRVLVAALLLALLTGPALAVSAIEQLDDPALESRARVIFKDLRCLVCQNQSIDESDAGLAQDLRVLVRERLVAGDTDDEIVDYIVSRYGDFVLLNPPFKASTYVLWLGPAIILVLGAAGVVVHLRRHGSRTTPSAPLTADERRKLDAMIDDG